MSCGSTAVGQIDGKRSGRGFPKRHQLDLLQELFSHLSFLSRFFDPSLLVTSFC